MRISDWSSDVCSSDLQSFLPNSDSTLRMARRKSSASAMLSSTSAVPPGGSIMAAATSQEAIMAYCGDVDVCIRYASLNTLRSSLRVSESSSDERSVGNEFVSTCRSRWVPYH